jgi:hypothetical protein
MGNWLSKSGMSGLTMARVFCKYSRDTWRGFLVGILNKKVGGIGGGLFGFWNYSKTLDIMGLMQLPAHRAGHKM